MHCENKVTNWPVSIQKREYCFSRPSNIEVRRISVSSVCHEPVSQPPAARNQVTVEYSDPDAG